MKNNRGGSILPKIVAAPAAVTAAVLALGVQILLTRNAAEDGTLLSLLIRGGIVPVVILTLGCLALCLVISALFRKLRGLEDLVKPLSERDFSALTALSENPAAGEDPAAAPLRESLAALGKFLEALERRISKNREMKNVMGGEAAEQDAVLDHMEKAAETIASRFYDIEDQSKQGIEALESLAAGIKSLGDAAEDPVQPEDSKDRLSRVAELSESVAGRLRESSDRAKKIQEAVGAGEEQAQEANDIVKAIVKEVDSIAELINIINQISEQTNILSMNAAIESAHAGQAGAGFAVVADEIRKLADSTRENAARIHGELKEITGKTKGALKASEDSFLTFNGVSGEINRLAKDLAEISAAAAEETSGLNDELGGSFGNTAPVFGRIKEGISGVMAHYQSFKTMLEQIGDLSGKTRTGIREIHSGTREILENIHTAGIRFLQYLEETEDMEMFLPRVSPAAALSPPAAVPAAAPALPHPAAVPAAPPSPAPPRGSISFKYQDLNPVQGAIPAFKAGDAHGPAGETREDDYPDSREVAVKKPPQTIP
ncbi:MAG: methyl-accepting chemotaxis protein [Treponema sp.]|jgi:methyl-accepting chemotaxis protein|nr:methyl-accepting chemotaxis protein [Treponema sp.]